MSLFSWLFKEEKPQEKKPEFRIEYETKSINICKTRIEVTFENQSNVFYSTIYGYTRQYVNDSKLLKEVQDFLIVTSNLHSPQFIQIRTNNYDNVLLNDEKNVTETRRGIVLGMKILDTQDYYEDVKIAKLVPND